jgi:predicted nucleotidyltransferase
MSKSRDEVLRILASQKPLLLANYGLTDLGIFGSYARGQQTEGSDLDLLVDYEKAPTLFKLIELRDYLSQLLMLRVDIVTRNGLKSRIRDRVLAEVIYL